MKLIKRNLVAIILFILLIAVSTAGSWYVWDINNSLNIVKGENERLREQSKVKSESQEETLSPELREALARGRAKRGLSKEQKCATEAREIISDSGDTFYQYGGIDEVDKIYEFFKKQCIETSP